MKLLLVRHGQAAAHADDSSRPLTDSGRRAVGRVGKFLAGAVQPAEVRHSTKLRAKQTAEVLARALGLDVDVREVEGLDPIDDVRSLARELSSESRDLVLVGHLPHLGRLASQLVCDEDELDGFVFEAGTALALERIGDGSLWVVRWMIAPSLLPA